MAQSLYTTFATWMTQRHQPSTKAKTLDNLIQPNNRPRILPSASMNSDQSNSATGEKQEGARPRVDSHHPKFDEYAQSLTLLDDFLDDLRAQGITKSFTIVDFATLEDRNVNMPGKNRARIVTGSPIYPHRHVYKGFDFTSFLRHAVGSCPEESFHAHQRDTMLEEIRTLASLPPHPNIMPCPEMLVIVRDANDGRRICGFLQPVLERETLDDQIVKAARAGKRIPLARMARWCAGMAKALIHTHRVGGTYHMDVKPGNMLVDDEDEIRLIDWEKSGVSMFTHAKEVTIDQDAQEVDSEDGTTVAKRIVYTPRDESLPLRKNLYWGYPNWNNFPVWKETCPRAAELAEVFSLGRVMWMLFEQLEQNNKPTVWTELSARHVPGYWIEFSKRCQAEDPNDRPSLDEVAAFFKSEEVELTRGEQPRI